MNNQDKECFAQLLSFILRSYSLEGHETMFIAFWEVLKPYSIEDIENAFRAHLGDTERGQYPPKPADIKRQLEGSRDQLAMEALAKLDKALSTVGIYRSVEFDEPIIANVIKDMGGWKRLCMVTYNDYPFVRKEFADRYIDYVANNKYDPNLLMLKGIEESSTVAIQSSRPVKIGSIHLTSNLKIELKDDLVAKEPNVKEEALADDQKK